VRRRVRGAAWGVLYGAGRLFQQAATACFWAAAGTLTLEDLRRAAVRRWREYAATQPDADDALMDWEEQFYGRFLRPGERVLLAGCGSGRDLIALVERGFTVEGLDPVAECIEQARTRLAKRGMAAPLHVAWLEDAAPPPGPFGAVVLSWFCYGYIPGAAARVRTLRALAERLTPDGRILVSYLTAGKPPRPVLIRLARLVARLSGSDWRPEDGDSIVLTDRRPDGACFEHFFRPGEVEAEGRAAGLRLLHDEPSPYGRAVLAP
jgi:SAM-dependent methyltransferase